MATKSIGTGGGRDYSSLAAWASYVNALSLTENEIGEVYADAEIVESAALTIGGWTANGFSVTLRAAAGQGFGDHANKATNPLRYNASVGAAIRSTYGSSSEGVPYAFDFTGVNLRIEGLQFQSNGASNSITRAYRVSGAGFVAERFIFSATKCSNLLTVSASSTFRNGLLHARDMENGSNCAGAGTTGVTYENCHIVKSGTGTATGFSTAYANDPTLKNVVVFGFSTDISNNRLHSTSTHLASDKSTVGGTNYTKTSNQNNVASSDFVSVTNGSEDWRPASSSTKLLGTGTTLGSVTVDIVGQSRVAPYSIGAFQPVSNTAPAVTTHPSSQSVVEGTTATFTAAFSGSPTPTYQWQRNPGGSGTWSNISGATSTSYTTPATTVTGGSANNTDQYRCVATNSEGSATTNAATLTVTEAGDETPPTFTGELTASLITQTSFALAGPTATDDVGVVGYEYSINGGGTYTPTTAGGPSQNISGLTPGTLYPCRMRAYDAAGNRSSALSLEVTTAASGATINSSVLKNNTGTVLASLPFEAYVHNATTGALVLKKTGLTSSIGGVVGFTDAALLSATTYRVVWRRTDNGAEGMETITTS